MCTAKEKHCVIQPQILPNLLDHSQKREVDNNYEDIAIGTLLGTVDGKIINISNSFPMRTSQGGEKEEGGSNKHEITYNFDTKYLTKMLKFHKQVNELESILGVYISSTNLGERAKVIVDYYLELFTSKKVKSPLPSPIVMLFDPSLNNNKLEIKVSQQFDALYFLDFEHPLVFPARESFL